MLKAFQDAKAALVKSMMLAYPRQEAASALLTTAASGEVVGAALQRMECDSHYHFSSNIFTG